ncbi:hypothetical protein CYFUS_001541 [Cystobacter fuscus]|uniref:CHAT domain-containing protein n=1 Tax=Cystobacter fuscus TaxID=43 RepID=A0A250IY37_9BACT|nr:CHAT domain-containing tetratricopeptide repeat protein [Cystobacter fuscus]ATB36127.1 hypothetical protein CYFUS_001541 [Cystobacter fuscus]
MEAERYAEVVPLAERALELREAALGETHLEVARCLNLLGDALQAQGRYTRAEPILQRGLAIREVALGKSHPDVANSLNNLAILYEAQGLYAQARPLLERSLAIRETALGKHHPAVAGSLNNLARLYEVQGLYAQAQSLYERALAIKETALGKSHPDVANSLNNLANLYGDQGLYARVEPLLERALEIKETALGKSSPAVAIILSNLAINHWNQGLYARAEPLLERALAIQEEALGKHHPAVANTLNSLGVLYKTQGLLARAEPLLERALAIQEEALGKHHPAVANSLSNLARLHEAQGLYARAEPLLERALAIQEEALGKHHPAVASSLSKLALLYQAQGLYARAEPLHERALAIWETAFGRHHPDVGHSLNNLADLYLAQGLHARAEPLYERALATFDAALGKSHPNISRSLNGLARLRLAQQRLDEALPLFERAITVSEKHLRQEVLGSSEAGLARLLQLLRDEEEGLYSLVRVRPDNARVRHLALSAALLRKGRSVEELADTSRIIYRGLGQADREAFERLRALRTQRSKLSLSGSGSLSPADYQRRLEELATQSDAIEADLSKRSEPLRAHSALPPPAEIIERVAAALPREGALIELITYRDSPLVPEPGTPPSGSPGELRYLALLLFADGRTAALDLGPAAPIDRAAQRLHDALASRAVSYQSAAQALYALAFRPLVPLLGKAQRLFLSPDGQLSLIPFAALHDGSRFLVDAWDLTYLTSGKDLLPRPEDSTPPRAMVVLADPEFDSAAPSLAARAEPVSAERSAPLERFFSTPRSVVFDQPWPPLPGTRKEAEAIQRLLPQAQLLLGRDATKEALLKLPTPGLLHIATHGFFLEDAPVPAGTRAVKYFGAVGEAGPTRRPPDPLLRSGLVLAGAHAPEAQPGSRRREDSLVTALELAGLNLWGTQLVVLSACDTGRGDIKLGQGVHGLRRALMVAGAQTLVTSLWKVNDETTRELMESYYGGLLSGQGLTAALGTAMRTLRQKHPHPHFWAPFILLGKDGPLRGLTPHTGAPPIP